MINNTAEHITLYAKGKYIASEKIADLKTIIQKTTKFSDNISIDDIDRVLVSVVAHVCQLSYEEFNKLLESAITGNLVDSCLNKLSVCDTDNLGGPDPNILPVVKEEQ